MTQTTDNLPTAEVPDPDGVEARFDTGIDELLDRFETEEVTEEQIREEVIRPFFDKIDDAALRGEIKDDEGNAYARSMLSSDFQALREAFTKPHAPGEASDFDPLRHIPESGGLRRAVDELLLNSLTDKLALQEIAERYDEQLELEQVQEVLGETAVESSVETEDVSALHDARTFSRDERRRLREAAQRIEGEEPILTPPSVEDVEEEIGAELVSIREQINSLIGRLPVAEQGALDRLGEALADRDQEKINAAWVDGISEDVQRNTGLIEELTRLYVRKRELEPEPEAEQ